jgi:Exostosin family
MAKRKVFVTAIHPNNYTLLAGSLLLERYEYCNFEIAKMMGEADIILYLEYGYTGLTDLRKLASRIRCAKSAKHFIFSEADWPFPVLPGAYTSLAKPYPWAHSWAFLPRLSMNANREAAQEVEPRFLFSFLGRIATHPVRRKILLLDTPKTPCLDVADGPKRFHCFDYSKTYSDLITQSKFVLCPRGFGASSIRIFEAMRLGRVPVIISDQWQEPPGIPWRDCCVVVAEDKVSHIPYILGPLESRAHLMGRLAKRIYEENYAPNVFLDQLLTSLLKEYSACSFTIEEIWRRACWATGWREFRSLFHQALSAIVDR